MFHLASGYMSMSIIVYIFSIYIYYIYIYICIFMYLRLFFPLGGTGRDDIAARLLLHQLHTTAEANHSLRTDMAKSVEVFFWLVKLSDLKMFGMSYVLDLSSFFSLWEVGIVWDTLRFLRNGSTKILETSLSSESDSTGCHALELLSFSQQNFQHPCLLSSPGFNGFNLWLGWHVGSGQTILQRRFLENACDLAWLEALLYLKGMM